MSQPEFSHRWSPIADLPPGHEGLASDGLKALRNVWLEQKAELEARDAVKEFSERLLRRWAIETGLIERLYTLDRGITELLVERGLDASLVPNRSTNGNPEHIVRMIRDQHDAVAGLFDFVAARRELGTSYIKELHATLTANQSHIDAVDPYGKSVQVLLQRGEYKRLPNSPREPDGRVHEYCPPEQVASEMDQLIEMHRRHQSEGVAPEVEAAWLHHRFTQIHPFQDGNGRVARALATLILLKARSLPLVVTNNQRAKYIEALRTADKGELRALVELFARIEKRTFRDALEAAGQAVQYTQRTDALIAAMRDTLEKRRAALMTEWHQAKDIGWALLDIAEEQLKRLAEELTSELGPSAPSHRPFEFFVNRNQPGDDRTHWFRYQIVETAKAHGYFANIGSYHGWARLVLKTTGRSEILLSLHGLGQEYRGVVVGSLCIFEKDAEGGYVTLATNVGPLTDEPFQVTYKESEEAVVDRFSKWLDQGLGAGLAAAHKLM